MSFKKATKFESKARIAIMGPAKSGKSYSSLLIASGLGKRIAAIDTEHGSLSKYSHLVDFDVEELSDFSPSEYIRCIQTAEREGYDVLVIDSLSHAWAGKGGILQQVDEAASKTRSGSTFDAWRDPSKLHTELIEAIHSARVHIIATLRAKMAYVLEANDKGKMVPRKVGLQPIQRDELEYEFDFVGTLDSDHIMSVGESRLDGLGFRRVEKPDAELGRAILGWLAGEKRPLLGQIGDMAGTDLRAASAAALGRYVDALKHLLEGKHGPKADAARVHLGEVERLLSDKLGEERQAAESGSYIGGDDDSGDR